MGIRSKCFASIVITGVFVCLTGAAQAEDSIPFQLRRGSLIVIEGSIGALTGLTFVVDTGTSRTIIGRHVARRLGLSGRPDEVLVFRQVVPVERVMLPELRSGSLQVSSSEVLVKDFSAMEHRHGFRIDGILGMDLLGRRCFRVDYRAQRLHFGRQQHWAATVPFERNSPYLVVEGVVDGRPLRLLVDTGADHIVLFAEQIDPQWRDSALQPATAEAVQASGHTRLRQTRRAEVRIGQNRLRTQNLYVIEVGKVRYPYDGILGTRALGSSRVQFDFQNMLLGWGP